MRHLRIALASSLLARASLHAQTAPKVAPCDTSSILAHAPATYGVGPATIRNACGTFANAISLAFKAHPEAQRWTGSQLVNWLLLGAVPVVDTPKPPPAVPPVAIAPPGKPCANEPAGATRFEDQPWNTVLPKGWVDDVRTGFAKGAIVIDSTAPVSAPNVVAGTFAKGDPGGSGAFYIYRPFSSSEQFSTLYLCVALKHSSDFDNTNGNAGTKLFWPAGDQIGGAMTYITLNGAQMDVGVNQQGGSLGQDGREMYANLGVDGHVYARRGTWIVYEFLLRASSSNTSNDGTLDVWLDGVHTHRYTDVRWQMASDRHWKSLAWNPTYGGGLNPVPHDQYEYIDHLRLSGVP